MKCKNLRDGAHVCALALVVGLLAWLLGQPLIVSLGVLPTTTDGALITAAVVGMFLAHRLVMLVRDSP
jgi:hypothetical protein